MKANTCEHQRTFPWMAALPAPQLAPQPLLAACTSEEMAMALAMKLKPGGPYSDSWFAERLGVSRSYLCEIKKGVKPMPVWMRKPFAHLTGSLLLSQWHDLQSAMRAVQGRPTQADRIDQLLASVGLREAA
jgi:hypothetical protein